MLRCINMPSKRNSQPSCRVGLSTGPATSSSAGSGAEAIAAVTALTAAPDGRHWRTLATRYRIPGAAAVVLCSRGALLLLVRCVLLLMSL